MPAKVSILLITTRSARERLVRAGYSAQQLIEDAKKALAETYRQATGQELAESDIVIDSTLDRKDVEIDILIILAVPRGWIPLMSRQGIGSQSEQILKSWAMGRGIDPDAIPKMQIETIFTQP